MGQQLCGLREENQSCWMGTGNCGTLGLDCKSTVGGKHRHGQAAVGLRKGHLLGEIGEGGGAPHQLQSSTGSNSSSLRDTNRTHLPRGRPCSYPGQMRETNQASGVWVLYHPLLEILPRLAVALNLTSQFLTLLTSPCRACPCLSPKLYLLPL